MVISLLSLSASLLWSRAFPKQILSPDLRWWAEVSAEAGSLRVRVSSEGRTWSVSLPFEGPDFGVSLEEGGVLKVRQGERVLVFEDGRLVRREPAPKPSKLEPPFPFPEPFVRFVRKTPWGYLVAGPRLLVAYSEAGRELWRFRAPGSVSYLAWDGSRAWLAWGERETGEARLVALDEGGRELLRLNFEAEGEPAFVARVWSEGRELRVLCSRVLYVYRLEG